MSSAADIVRKARHYLERAMMLPNHVAEAVERLRRIESALPATPPVVPAPAVSAGEIYSGYSNEDLRLFDLFTHARPQPSPGFVTDFIGTRTRTSSLWNEVRALDGQVMGRPVPHDLFETIEWVGLLKAVVSACDGRFVMMELGAGWGPWLVAGSVAARLRGLNDLCLRGVEADPGRFELMRQHFLDNGLDPDAHLLLRAAVGVEAGRARWPCIYDPANAGGARPVREAGTEPDKRDMAYMQGAIANYIEVEILPLGELLASKPSWDLMHIDVQGWENGLCRGCIDQLNERVRWVVVDTHSRQIDGELIALFTDADWVLENEKPTRFVFDATKQSLESMTVTDGTQVWRNQRLAATVQV